MKRILAFLLVAVMTASVFAGCANTGNAVSNGVSESKTSTSETKPQISSAALSKQTNLKSKNTETDSKKEFKQDFNFSSNSISKLNLINSDSTIESYYPNNAYHPKLIDMGKEWNGYRFWLSYTPYPSGNDYYENPQIVGTNDLINYSEVKFTEPPLANYKKSVRYNSDSHLVYNKELDRLELFWRYTDYDTDYMALYMRYSYDGDNWSDKLVYFETYEKEKYDMVSPAIIRDDGAYKVWYVCHYQLYYRELRNGVWSQPQPTDLTFEDGAYVWHPDVIKTNRGYELLACATTNKKDRKHMNLYFSASEDGLSWETAMKVASPSEDYTAWDGGGLYRPSFIYANNHYIVMYSARNDYDDFGTGLLVGRNMFNLHGTDLDYINNGQADAPLLWDYLNNDL